MDKICETEEPVIVLDPDISELQVGVLAKPPLFLPCFINMKEQGIFLDCFSPLSAGVEDELNIKLTEGDDVLEAMMIVCRMLADAAFALRRLPPNLVSLNGPKSQIPVWPVRLEAQENIDIKATFPYLREIQKQIPQFRQYSEAQFMKKLGAFSRAIVH